MVTEVAQRAGTVESDLESRSSDLEGSWVAETGNETIDVGRDVVALSGNGQTVLESPVRYEGENVYFRPELMPVNEPIPAWFLDNLLLVVKRSDDSLDFYTLG